MFRSLVISMLSERDSGGDPRRCMQMAHNSQKAPTQGRSTPTTSEVALEDILPPLPPGVDLLSVKASLATRGILASRGDTSSPSGAGSSSGRVAFCVDPNDGEGGLAVDGDGAFDPFPLVFVAVVAAAEGVSGLRASLRCVEITRVSRLPVREQSPAKKKKGLTDTEERHSHAYMLVFDTDRDGDRTDGGADEQMEWGNAAVLVSSRQGGTKEDRVINHRKTGKNLGRILAHDSLRRAAWGIAIEGSTGRVWRASPMHCSVSERFNFVEDVDQTITAICSFAFASRAQIGWWNRSTLSEETSGSPLTYRPVISLPLSRADNGDPPLSERYGVFFADEKGAVPVCISDDDPRPEPFTMTDRWRPCPADGGKNRAVDDFFSTFHSWLEDAENRGLNGVRVGDYLNIRIEAEDTARLIRLRLRLRLPLNVRGEASHPDTLRLRYDPLLTIKDVSPSHLERFQETHQPSTSEKPLRRRTHSSTRLVPPFLPLSHAGEALGSNFAYALIQVSGECMKALKSLSEVGMVHGDVNYQNMGISGGKGQLTDYDDSRSLAYVEYMRHSKERESRGDIPR